MVRVLIVRDTAYLGGQVHVSLSCQPDIHVVGAVSLEDDVADYAAATSPEVIVIDTGLMVGQVLPIAGELHARLPACALLVLCDPSKRGMLPPRRHGSDVSFLLKDASPAFLADSVRRLAAGERIVHPRLQAASLNTERALSTRELVVLGLAAEGDSVNDIAQRLYLSGGTVRNYLSSVISKTGARNRIDAIRIVRKQGWLS
jgi:two-component system response regulator DesR